MNKKAIIKLYQEKGALTTLKMDNRVYQLRKDAIKIIYEVKAKLKKLGIDFPRIEVRIATPKTRLNKVVGQAMLKRNHIWISEKLNEKEKYQVVLHELAHAAYGIEHNENCKLMSTATNDISNKEAMRLFVEYAKELNK